MHIDSEESYIDYMQRLVEGLGNYIIEDNGTYQLDYSSILWNAGDGRTVRPDMVRIRTLMGGNPIQPRPNSFFQDFYKSIPTTDVNLEAKDHTGQVSKEEREQREHDFLGW